MHDLSRASVGLRRSTRRSDYAQSIPSAELRRGRESSPDWLVWDARSLRRPATHVHTVRHFVPQAQVQVGAVVLSGAQHLRWLERFRYRIWVKIFCLGRIFFLVYIVISPSWSGDVSQLIGLQGVIVTTLFFEGLAQPRTTRFLNILEFSEEIVLFTFLEIGFAATGLCMWL